MRSACLLVLGRNLWTYRPKSPAILTCPAGCPSASDSPTHGICLCPQALRVWTACLPLLRAMGVHAPISLLPHGIIGAWQHLPGLRPRLVLWRNAVLVTLHTARVTAGRDTRTGGTRPNFHHCDTLDVLFFATASVISALTATWGRIPEDAPAARDRFRGRWVSGSSLLHIDGLALLASPLPGSPSSSPTASQPLSGTPRQ